MNFSNLELTDSGGCFHLPDPKLVKIATALVAYYSQLAPNYCSTAGKVRQEHLIHFYRAAEICDSLGQQPEAYMRAQLDSMAASGRIWPQAVACRLSALSSQDTAIGYYIAQLELFDSQLKIMGKAETVIRDLSCELSPLVRCVLAHKFGVMDIYRKFLPTARLELATVPSVREVFSEDIGAVDGL